MLKSKKVLSHQGILLIITLVTYFVFACSSETFRKFTNFFTILRTMSIVSVIAVGVTFVITLGEIDLSIETVPGLCAAVFCILVESGTSVIVAMLAALAVALIIGFVNGLIVVKTKLPSIIVTLATAMIVGGLSEVTTSHRAIVVSVKSFVNFFNFKIGNFPGIALWMVLFVLIAYVILHRTNVGLNIELVGDNREAAVYSGIKVNRTIATAFLISALFSFLAGMLGVSVSSNATPDMLREYMMTAIASTVIGGTDMQGGKGSITGTIIGAFFLSTIANGFLLLGIQQWTLYLVNGIVIILTLSIKELPRLKQFRIKERKLSRT